VSDLSKPEDWRMPVPMRLVDISEQARLTYGADKAQAMYPALPDHDWRFEAVLPSGATVTFGRHCTAERMAAFLKGNGVAVGEVR